MTLTPSSEFVRMALSLFATWLRTSTTKSKPNQVTEEEFSRAKNVITARAAVQSSRRSEALDSLYRSSLLDSAEPFDITLQDVQNAAKELLSSKPTIYASGDLTGLPSFAY